MKHVELLSLTVATPDLLVPRYYSNPAWGGLTLDGPCNQSLGSAVMLKVTVEKPHWAFTLHGTVGWIRRQNTPKLGPGFGIDMSDDSATSWERMLSFARGEIGPEAVRQLVRMPVSLPAELTLGSMTLKETVTDLSSGGAFISTTAAASIAEGSEVQLKLLPVDSRAAFSLNAKVCWRRVDASPGVGVQFVDVHTAVSSAVGALARKLSEQASQQPGAARAG